MMMAERSAASGGDAFFRASLSMETARRGLVDHVPGEQFTACGSSPKKAPVDFGDVFGGPPRGLSANVDAVSAVGAGGVLKGEAGTERSRRWSASAAEKPVFGVAGFGSPRAAHRRHLGDDFFCDIFRGDESASPSPRMRDQDPFPAASTVLSPTLSRPSPTDVFGGVSALPAHLSSSSRSARSFDYSSFKISPGFAVCQLEETPSDVFSVPSSPYISATTTAQKRSLHLKSLFTSDNQLNRTSTFPKSYGGSRNFHFSLYKLASKGVALVVPSGLKGRAKGGSRLGATSSEVWYREDLPIEKQDMFQGFQNQSKVTDESPRDDLASSRNGYIDSSKETTETLPAASDTMPDHTSGSQPKVSGRDPPMEEGKPKLKNLQELLGEHSEGEGDEDTTRHTKKNEDLARATKAMMKDVEGTERPKQENISNFTSDRTEIAGQERHGAARKILDDRVLPSRTRGRVKQRIKISNPEALEKDRDSVESQTTGPKVEEKAEDFASAHKENSNPQYNGNHVEASHTPVGQNVKEKLRDTMKGLSSEKLGSFPKRSGTKAPQVTGSTLGSFDALFFDMEDLQVEELPQDYNSDLLTNLREEECEEKVSDSRIQQWLKGKEGNIRSLLSTLQYILWPGCGWKPIPLVDIIEGASVRRAYQKALLCLHPDKLQQKGAEKQHKYIAEKVFDILQEAWDHFNLQSSL